MQRCTKVPVAVSVLCGIPLGIGASIAIDLWTEARMSDRDELSYRIGNDPKGSEKKGSERNAVNGEKNIVDDLLLKAVQAKVRELAVDPCRISVVTPVPPAKGLKTSSSASLAMLDVMLRSQDRVLSPEELALLSAEASLKAGVSVTGAIDDAFTCSLGGLCISRIDIPRLVRRTKLSGPEVVLWIPDNGRPKKDVDVSVLKAEPGFKKVRDLVMANEIYKAMTLNGSLVAKCLDYDEAPQKEALRSGALAASVSGTGPAVAALCERKDLPSVTQTMLEIGNGKVITTKVISLGMIKVF